MAKVQLESDRSGAGEIAIDCLTRWADRKFVTSDSSTQIRGSGEEALFERSRDQTSTQTGEVLSVLQPIRFGDLKTDVSVVYDERKCSFQVILSASSTAGTIAPRATIRSPRFVQEIVEQGGWSVARSSEQVRPHALFLRERELAIVERLLSGEGRRLPIILVSEFEGLVLAQDLDQCLARDLCGIAHVVRLTREASWGITNRIGKEWSAYNGAVRLLWPMAGKLDNPRAHPLWTLDSLLAGVPDEAAARDRLRNALARTLLDATTFVPDDPVHSDFTKAIKRLAADTERVQQTNVSNTIVSLNEELRELREQVDERDKRIEALEANAAALLRVQRQSLIADDELDVAETQEVPQTVDEAIKTAERLFSTHLRLAAKVADDACELSPQAGPPEKLLRYLATLAELGEALDAGPLGKSIPIWLAERNVDCSGDSETTRKRTGHRSFQLSEEEGRVDCEWHAKPSDSVSPDKCVRIFFGIAEAAPRVRVGYIGRHVD